MVTVENVYGPPTVRPLILIDGSDWRNVTFNVGARFTWLDVGGFRSEWRNDVILGSQYGLRSEYYHPFTPTSQWFSAPRGFVGNNEFNIYLSDDLIAQYRRAQASGGLDVGREFGQTSELPVGHEGGWQHFSPQVGNRNLLPTFSGAYPNAEVQYRLGPDVWSYRWWESGPNGNIRLPETADGQTGWNYFRSAAGV